MSTLAEIEAAITTLTPEEMEQLETFLRDLRTQGAQESQDLEELYRRTGFVPFPKRPGKPVTIEMVQQLCEEEGI